MRTRVETTIWLNNELACSFSPEFCSSQIKRLTAHVLAQQDQLSVGVCGSAGLHIQTRALSSLFFAAPSLAKRGWFRLKRSRYRNHRLYS